MSGSALGSIARIGLTAAGYYFGGPAGAFVGSFLGSALFPEKIPGEPVLPDRPSTNSAEGQTLPEFFGSCVTGGNVFWDGGRRVKTKKKKVGAIAGIGGSTVKTRKYYRSYAIGLGKEIRSLRRIWRNESLVFDRRPQQEGESAGDYAKRQAASSEFEESMTVYLGTDDQMPDPTIEAKLGVGNAPAYRRRSYVVFKDLDETPRAGGISLWKFEVTRQLPVHTPTTELATDALAPWFLASDPRDFENGSFVYKYQILDPWGDLSDAQSDYLAEPGNSGKSIDNFDNLLGHSVTAPKLWRLYEEDNTDKLVLTLHFNRLTPTNVAIGDEGYVGNTADDQNPLFCDAFANLGLAVNSGRIWWSGFDLSGTTSTLGIYGIFRLMPGGAPLEADEQGANNCINYPPSEGFFPKGHVITDSLIRVKRALTQPPIPGIEFPDWPEDPENYTWDESSGEIFSKAPWVRVDRSYRALAILEEHIPSHTVTQLPVAPIMLVGASADNESAWTAAYNAAVSAGDIAAGKTFDATGNGGFGTYPRNIDHAWTRSFEAVEIPDTDTEILGNIVRRCSGLAGLAEEQIDVTDLTEAVTGFQLDSVQSARTAIDVLRRFGFFDVVASGSLIKYPRRGKASVAQFALSDIGAHMVGEAEPDKVRSEYINDDELPRVVRVSYIDQAGEYQRGQQLRGRTVTGSEDILDVQVPVVMSAEKGAQIRDVALAENWIGRETYTPSARPKWIVLEAADPIVFPLRGGLQRAIITKTTGRPGGVQLLELRRDDASPYYPTATGVPSGIGEQELEQLGDTTLVIIDGAALGAEDNDAGVHLAARGAGERWTGYDLLQSIDGGSNYDQIAELEGSSTMGVITAALSVGPYHLWDRANAVEVTLDSGTLESRTEEAVTAGSNLAWVGHPSRGWELVGFADAALTGTDVDGRNVYQVSTLLRGRQGTEWAIGSSQASDHFILADTCDRLSLDPSAIGVARLLKAVSFGLQEESGPTQAFTPGGVALKPFAPALLTGSRDGSGNLQIFGTRRARLSGEWNDSDFVPLNEESERYEVEVLDGVDVVRTIAANSFPIAYSAADQVADFGSPQVAIDIVIYQISATVGRGYPTEATV